MACRGRPGRTEKRRGPAWQLAIVSPGSSLPAPGGTSGHARIKSR
ncbi:hypothetical protein BURCENBC7_AP3855 [Burkholderia cenocepacia BC7]|nr:hypothetical protein BURCENK562V_C5576 [Burkholderia cenocepacia K56-2Valvano]ERI32182.1 hypothetical protein BURCENBC7_AP3855 [Burkholderia cenocepacia BC7]